jgi:hypothetical protein
MAAIEMSIKSTQSKRSLTVVSIDGDARKPCHLPHLAKQQTDDESETNRKLMLLAQAMAGMP